MSINTILKVREGAGCTVDLLSIARNGASAVKEVSAIPAAMTAISAAALTGGLLGLPIGLSLFYGSCKDMSASIACKDREGIVQNGLMGTTVFGYAAISGVLAANGIMGLAHIAAPAAMGGIIGGIGLGMYVPMLGFAINGLIQTKSFANQLDKKKDPHEALKWLAHEIGLDATGKTREKKMRQFQRRTDSDCAQFVAETLPALLKKFDPEKAKTLIGRVKKANFKQQVKYGLFTAIALLGIAAFVLMLVLSGPASSILFAVGAALWLTVDSSKLHNWIGEKCWDLHVRLTQKGEKGTEETPLLRGRDFQELSA
jgi:hypothetical protein